jgi:multidrug efflux system membrane fusion protein
MDDEKRASGDPSGEDRGSPAENRYPNVNTPAEDELEERRHKRQNRNIWIVIILVILVIGVIRYWHYKSAPGNAARNQSGAAGGAGGKGAQQGAAAVTAGQSRMGDANVYVTALGTVTPIYTVTVYSQITGRVMAVHYKEGQLVRKGQRLVEIDPRPYQAMLTQAQGTLERDKGVLAQAKMDLDRYRAAWARNAIPKQQLDDQEQAVVQYEGTVKADQGTVAYDKVQLEYCHIVSPINGRVGLRLVDPGNTVFSGSSSVLVVITQLQPITVVFNVSEDSLPQVQEQLSAGHKLDVDAFDRANEKKIEPGKLSSLDNQIDTTTGTVKFRGEFPNKKLALFPNQFVNARLLVNILHGATLVPSAAVQHNGTAAFVYVINANNTVSVQPVVTLTGDERETAVQGLNPNVKVATSGFDRLEDGATVSVRNPPANQNKAGQNNNATPNNQGAASSGSAGGKAAQ